MDLHQSSYQASSSKLTFLVQYLLEALDAEGHPRNLTIVFLLQQVCGNLKIPNQQEVNKLMNTFPDMALENAVRAALVSGTFAMMRRRGEGARTLVARLGFDAPDQEVLSLDQNFLRKAADIVRVAYANSDKSELGRIWTRTLSCVEHSDEESLPPVDQDLARKLEMLVLQMRGDHDMDGPAINALRLEARTVHNIDIDKYLDIMQKKRAASSSPEVSLLKHAHFKLAQNTRTDSDSILTDCLKKRSDDNVKVIVEKSSKVAKRRKKNKNGAESSSDSGEDRKSRAKRRRKK